MFDRLETDRIRFECIKEMATSENFANFTEDQTNRICI